MNILKLSFIYCTGFFLFFLNSSHAEYYLNKKINCEPNEETLENPVGHVRSEWIRRGPSDQGDSNTCGFHASVDMISALYRSQQPKDQIPQVRNSFSVLDSMTKSQKVLTECGLGNMRTNIVAQLLRIQRDPKLSAGPTTQWTMKRALEMNLLLDQQAKDCASGTCQNTQACSNGCHAECLSSLCTHCKPFFGLITSINDFSAIASKINSNPKDPILAFTEEMRENRESIPPFQIQTWDTFSNAQEITDQVIEYFKRGESILPLGITFCQEDHGDLGCKGKHVVAAQALRKISCKDRSTGQVRSFHVISFMGSIPSMDQGSFVLEDLTQGMFKHQLGLAAISRCDQKNDCQDSPLLDTPHSHPFFHYADAGDVEKMLKIGGSGENFKSVFDKNRGHSGLTALHESALNHNLHVTQALIQKGISLDGTDQIGETALYIASQNGFADLVKMLLEAGAKPDLPRTSDLQTPIFIAATNGHTEIVQELIKKGAQVNSPIPSDHATPLFMASQEGHIEVVKLLLKNGAQAQTQLDTGQSALYAAVAEGHAEIIALLLQHGAGEEIKQGDQTQIWNLAVHFRAKNPRDKKWDTILELLKPYRSNPQAQKK